MTRPTCCTNIRTTLTQLERHQDPPHGSGRKKVWQPFQTEKPEKDFVDIYYIYLFISHNYLIYS